MGTWEFPNYLLFEGQWGSPLCSGFPIMRRQVAAFLVSPEGDGALRAGLCLFLVGVVFGMPPDVCLCRVG